MKLLFFVILGLLSLSSRAVTADTLPSFTPDKSCAKRPSFVSNHNFQKPALTTSERMKVGLVLIDLKNSSNTYQHPSWKSFGRLGPIITTESGDAYLAPVPNVSIEQNPFHMQNSVLKLNAQDGVLEEYFRIPVDHSPSLTNPFGIVGMTYSCDKKILYISTVSGSTAESEHGKIVAFSLKSKRIISELPKIDAMGLSVLYRNGEPLLFFGKARESSLYEIALHSDGTFSGAPKQVLTFDPFGQQRARKISLAPDGTLRIDGTEFYYSLLTAFEIEQNVYRFRFEDLEWKIVQ